MIRFTEKQRENLAKTVFDMGKLTFATLVLGSIISTTPLNICTVVSGSIATIICFAVGTSLDQ